MDFVSAAQQTLQDLHERVGLDAWWVSRQLGDEQVVLAAVDQVYGHGVGTVRSWQKSFCRRMVEEDAPQAAPRLQEVPAYAEAQALNSLAATAVLVVPIKSPSGEVLGTVCALGRESHSDLAGALQTVQLQASMLGALLFHELRLADEVRRAERAERASLTDALTEVGNRRSWDAALATEEVRAARYATAAAVLVLDLDGLKTLNDVEGHQSGDQLLRRTAALVQGRLRSCDVLARLGGDEFGVLLPETELRGALVLADQLRDVLAQEGITASLGVGARGGRGGEDGLRAAWRQADAAMYLDKASKDHRRELTAPARDGAAPGTTVHAPTTAALLGAAADARAVEVLLGMVKDQLGADVAFVSTLVDQQRRLRNVVSGIELPVAVGFTEPSEGTYCQLLLDGVIGPVTPDTAASVELRDHAVTSALGIGSYVGVPLHRRDGRVYGTLCAFSQRPDTGLRDRDAGILRAVAGAVMTVVESEDADLARRHAVLARLDDLYAAGGPATVYQPVLSLDGLHRVGAEALSRFPPGTPAPAGWFADATAMGVGARLETVAVTNALPALGVLDGFLALNVSAAAVMSPVFARVLAGLPLHRLVLEITEHEAVADYQALTAALQPWRRQGLRIAVDDTGAGFASMRHVLALVPDLIKLDISLVRGIDTDRARQALAAALATFAAATGAQVVAEGIETHEELDCLRGLGVGYGQGFHLAPPAPLPEPPPGDLGLLR